MYPLTKPDELWTILAAIAFTALLHASFQLAASVLTRLSGHTLGAKRTHKRLIHLMAAYIGGNLTMVMLLVCASTYLLSHLGTPEPILWAMVALVAVLTGALTILFYNRKRSSLLWLPDGLTNYLDVRTKKTKQSGEAFALGLTTAIAEVPFFLAPLLIVGMLLQQPDALTQLLLLGTYVVLAVSPLIIHFFMISSGAKISLLERWRSTHQRFLQLVCGLGLITLGIYLITIYYVGNGLGL